MDEILDEKLQKVEDALNAVISSTTQNNPSSTDAERLVDADQDLDDALQIRL
jgi:hypothetical protein